MKKEGIRRLSIAGGVLTALGVFLTMFAVIQPPVAYLWRIAVFSVVCGVFAWGSIKLIAWVIEGFVGRQDSK